MMQGEGLAGCVGREFWDAPGEGVRVYEKEV